MLGCYPCYLKLLQKLNLQTIPRLSVFKHSKITLCIYPAQFLVYGL